MRAPPRTEKPPVAKSRFAFVAIWPVAVSPVEFKQFEINELPLSAGKTTAFQFVRAVLR
jgi:hypothetical protein